MSGTPRLCLVEDDPTIRELVAAGLRQHGFAVDAYAETVGLAPQDAVNQWDLFILDVMIGEGRDGLDLCAKLRSCSPTLPILILSALGEPSDRVEGLQRGADDYLNKPFEMEELVLRIRGMLRRRSWYQAGGAAAGSFSWRGGSVDFGRLEAKDSIGKIHPLGLKEAMLLRLLVEREGQSVARDEILDKVWGYDAFPSTRTVDNFIVRLRRIFEKDPREPKFILSVRGLGYKFIR